MDAAKARERLEAERTRLTRLRDEQAGEDQGFGFGESTSETGGLNDQMGGDAASHIHDREVDSSILGHLEGELEETEAALQRVDEGTYGTCEMGGETISDERLEAVPSTRFCIEHAEQGELQRGLRTRGTGGLSG
jgi:RNA polymerase-binding transcription factor DksA